MGELFDGHLLANGLRSRRANKAVREEEAANAATINDSKPTSHSEYVESVKAGPNGQKEEV